MIPAREVLVRTFLSFKGARVSTIVDCKDGQNSADLRTPVFDLVPSTALNRL